MSLRIFLAGLLLMLGNSMAIAAEQQGPSNSGSEGANLFASHCAGCHGPEGKGTSLAPSLQPAIDRQLVEQRIRQGKGQMPAFSKKLSEEQIKVVADYVTTEIAGISLTGGNLSQGGILFRVNCAPCHRTAVRGGALIYTSRTSAPALTGLSEKTIASAVRIGPGPMPPFPPTVFNDQELASIVKYVQFMQKPPHPGGLPLGFYGPVAEGLVALVIVFFLALVCGWIEIGGKG